MVCWQNDFGNEDVQGEAARRERIYSPALWKVLGQPKACGRGSHFGRRTGSWGSRRRSGQFQNSQLGAPGLLHINKYHPSMALLGGPRLICNEKKQKWISQSGRMLKSLKYYRATFCLSVESSRVSASSSVWAEGCKISQEVVKAHWWSRARSQRFEQV